MRVTLDVFSGRPNPSWTLSGSGDRELVRRLQGLSPSAKPNVEGDLGYREFRIADPRHRPGFAAEIVIVDGVVATST